MPKVLDPPTKPATARRAGFAPIAAPAGKARKKPAPPADTAADRPSTWPVPSFVPPEHIPGAHVPTPADLPAAAELLARLFGPVPLNRVVWDPFPGTATLADCERFNEAGHLCELVDGVLLEKAVELIESEIALHLAGKVTLWDPDRRRGRRTGADGFVELFPDRTRGPDYSFFLHRRFPGGALPPNSRGSVKVPALVPDFAVEILSESNTRTEIDGKLDDLFATGCRLAWVVDPRARTARIITPAGGDAAGDDEPARPWVETTVGDDATLAGDPVLPGFAVSLAELLAAPDAAGEPGEAPEPAADAERTGG